MIKWAQFYSDQENKQKAEEVSMIIDLSLKLMFVCLSSILFSIIYKKNYFLLTEAI